MAKATLEHAIESVRKRPGMFLAKKSFHDFNTFLTGYLYALDVESSGSNSDGRSFSGGELRVFRHWLAARLGKSENLGTEALLLLETNNDDEAAFHRFFERWDEFLKAESGPI